MLWFTFCFWVYCLILCAFSFLDLSSCLYSHSIQVPLHNFHYVFASSSYCFLFLIRFLCFLTNVLLFSIYWHSHHFICLIWLRSKTRSGRECGWPLFVVYGSIGTMWSSNKGSLTMRKPFKQLNLCLGFGWNIGKGLFHMLFQIGF